MNKSKILKTVLLAVIGFGGIFAISNKNALAPTKLQIDTFQTQPSVITQKTNINTLSLPIFMYHHIDYFDNSTKHNQILTYIGVSSEKLKRELNLIQKLGFSTMTFQDIENNNIPTKPIILTFDDGYEDFYTKAYPELLKRNMSAIIYVSTDQLNTPGYLTTTQIKEMRNNHIEVGSHSLSHADLPSLNEEELKKQIFDSKAFLEKILNQSVLSFCYPYGRYSLKISNLVKEAGYKYATTVNPGYAKFNEPFDLARYKVYSDTDINNYIR